MMPHSQSKLALSKVWMCDAPEEAPADEAPAASAVADLSADQAATLESIKGMTLLEASQLIKEMESSFNVGPKKDDDDEEE